MKTYTTDINDPKYEKKSKLTFYLRKKINEYETNKLKIKSGRSNSLSIEACIDAILYVLVEGLTWHVASKAATGEFKYKSTLNRRFNKWISNGVIKDTYKEILNDYLNGRNIDELHIDSTDKA